MSDLDFEKQASFYIGQYRKMFRRIIAVFILIALCLCYLYYKLDLIEEPEFYASSQSGLLKKLSPYTEDQIASFMSQRKN